MKVTKQRIENGRYRVLIDGRATTFVIERGEPPKMFHHQEWDAIDESCDALMFSTTAGLHGALRVISAFVNFSTRWSKEPSRAPD